ncbi:hypothetical protein OS493_016028 [Desmophyllum pertusum]|uniref:Uncharacterized protein n=1 Tax=Desmophyllum pertusum TaxID=174260 RepID=A0A9X0A1M6_9CNID|nr:hypothetical protein OS493_016028 [Desmophyllum pertusum]
MSIPPSLSLFRCGDCLWVVRGDYRNIKSGERFAFSKFPWKFLIKPGNTDKRSTISHPIISFPLWRPVNQLLLQFSPRVYHHCRHLSSFLPSPSFSTTVSATSESPSSPHSVSSPAGDVSPTTSVQGTASAAPTGQTSTSPDVGTKGKTYRGTEIAGLSSLPPCRLGNGPLLFTTSRSESECIRNTGVSCWWINAHRHVSPAAAAQNIMLGSWYTNPRSIVEESESPTNVAAPDRS